MAGFFSELMMLSPFSEDGTVCCVPEGYIHFKRLVSVQDNFYVVCCGTRWCKRKPPVAGKYEAPLCMPGFPAAGNFGVPLGGHSYTERLCPKGLPFSGWWYRYIKG